eukprot:4351118-Pleurochrysis_carterae.AAC.1
MAEFTGRVTALLLGGTWNTTKEHTDKRRCVLVERDGNFYLSPLDKHRPSAGNAADLPAGQMPE